MSFVGPRNELLETACRNARARNMVLIAAAGNNGPKAPFGYPAAYAGVTAVTATDEQDRLMQQANRGPYVYLSAPGVDMIAPVGGGSDLVTGPSFAAAIVSGAVANLIRSNPERSADWIEKALAETATDLGNAGRDGDFGYGLLNAKAADAAKEADTAKDRRSQPAAPAIEPRTTRSTGQISPRAPSSSPEIRAASRRDPRARRPDRRARRRQRHGKMLGPHHGNTSSWAISDTRRGWSGRGRAPRAPRRAP